jgi:peptide/nickel transport system permease protein
MILTVLLGGLLGATLVRLGPGFAVDERELDSRLSAASQQAIRAERAKDNNLAVFYVRYLAGFVRGDFGFSRSLNRPVAELLKERLPLTLASLGFGVLAGASLGLALALLTVWWRAPGSDIVPGLLSGLCLAAPAAVI